MTLYYWAIIRVYRSTPLCLWLLTMSHCLRLFVGYTLFAVVAVSRRISITAITRCCEALRYLRRMASYGLHVAFNIWLLRQRYCHGIFTRIYRRCFMEALLYHLFFRHLFFILYAYTLLLTIRYAVVYQSHVIIIGQHCHAAVVCFMPYC